MYVKNLAEDPAAKLAIDNLLKELAKEKALVAAKKAQEAAKLKAIEDAKKAKAARKAAQKQREFNELKARVADAIKRYGSK